MTVSTKPPLFVHHIASLDHHSPPISTMKAAFLALLPLAIAVPHGRSRPHRRLDVVQEGNPVNIQLNGGLRVEPVSVSITHTGALAAVQTALNQLLSYPIKGPSLPTENGHPTTRAHIPFRP